MKRSLLGLCAVVGAVLLAGCSSSSSTSSPSGDCPITAVTVAVSVDQWGNIVEQLAGNCGNVSTVITSSSADPHDFEPATGDIATMTNAKLVVVNGDGYDDWATKAVDAMSTKPDVVNAATVNNVLEGSNPHLWYNPQYVMKTAEAVTNQLKTLAPQAASYFDAQQKKWQESMKPYFAEIAKIKSKASGKTYGATESVFDYMATACGLVDKTPTGYQNAAANESEPSPGDINAFNTALKNKQMNVLIFNTQTEGSVPNQLKSTAEAANVPVVSVTETMPSQAANFQQWQVAQLQELAKALGV